MKIFRIVKNRIQGPSVTRADKKITFNQSKQRTHLHFFASSIQLFIMKLSMHVLTDTQKGKGYFPSQKKVLFSRNMKITFTPNRRRLNKVGDL